MKVRHCFLGNFFSNTKAFALSTPLDINPVQHGTQSCRLSILEGEAMWGTKMSTLVRGEGDRSSILDHVDIHNIFIYKKYHIIQYLFSTRFLIMLLYSRKSPRSRLRVKKPVDL